MLSSNEFTTPTKTRYQAESTKFSSDNPNNISLTSSSSTPSKEICFSGTSYSEDKSKFMQSRHQHDRPRIASERFSQTDVESHLSSLSPRLPHQNFNMSSKVSRDSGCFDDASLTTLAISENVFPTRTSPTASDRSSHSAGLASHTDESGIHNMNEDCFFEEDENDKTSCMYKGNNSSRKFNNPAESKDMSVFLPHQDAKSPSIKCRSSNTKHISQVDENVPSINGKFGRSAGSGQSDRITESKFNSVRSIFEQKSKAN